MASITSELSSDGALPADDSAGKSHWLSWLAVVALIYALLIAVGAIGDGFKMAVGPNAKQLFAFADNPVVALIVGIVATAAIQSSSTVTSIIVGLVAGGLPMGIAIPMVMGANVGTSLTSTIVSLGSIRNGVEFQRAFAAATVHDMFNLMAVAILLPIEIFFKPLATVSHWLTDFFYSDASLSMGEMNFMKVVLAPGAAVVDGATGWLPTFVQGLVMIAIGVLAILFVVTAVGKILKKVLVGKAKKVLHTAVGRGPISGMASGTLITVMVQSSSTTTALIVPMAAAGIFNIRQVYAFTLGANIGTTITALLAATAITGPTAPLALQIALVHVLFNVFGILIIFGLPFLRGVPIWAAEGLAKLGQKNKLFVLAYILGVFFIIPLLIILISRLF